MAIEANTVFADQGESPFDPVIWLARFEAVGGTAWLSPEGPQFGWAVDGYSEGQNYAARAFYKEVQHDAERLEAIKSLIVAKANWRAKRAELEAIEAMPIGDCNDTSIDRAGDLAAALIGTPAPDSEALRWKLDWFLAGKSGSESYTSEYVAQVVADYRRFLGPA